MDNDNRLPERKKIRLSSYDYSSNGAYFVTLCVKDKKEMLSSIRVGTSIARPPEVVLTKYGLFVENAILQINKKYPAVYVGNYVIMPDHVHLLLLFYHEDRQNASTPTLSHIIQQLKGHITKQIGEPIWQARFYDHVIRNEQDYLEKYLYIEGNPVRWIERKNR